MWDSLQNQYRGKVEFQRLNVEDSYNDALKEKYQVKRIPAIIWTDNTGQQLNRTQGYMDEANWRSQIDAFLQSH